MTTLIHSSRTFLFALACALPLAQTAAADDPVVDSVAMEKTGMGWRISVTLSHPDTGWDHYADGWRIEDANGQVIGVRKLMHPHVNEQPFTRSLSSVILPDGTREIFIRARCSNDDWAQSVTKVDVPR